MRHRTALYSLAAIALVALISGGFLLSGTNLPLAANSPTDEDGSEVTQEEQTTTAERNTDESTEQEKTAAETNEHESTEQTQDDQKAAEQAAAEQQAATERRAAERRAAEQQAAEQRAAQRAAAEQAAAEQAAKQRAAEQAAAEQQAAKQEAQQQATVQEAPAERQDGWRDRADHQQAAEQAAAREEQPAVETAAPTSAALSLTVPKMGLYNDPVTNSIAESVLARGAGKIPSTGFPWQAGANTYIAAHVYGYPGTGSWQQFAALPSMAPGDAIYLTDSDGTTYEYRVTEIVRVAPTDVWVTQSTGQSMVSLQTCVGPGWSERLVVRAQMV